MKIDQKLLMPDSVALQLTEFGHALKALRIEKRLTHEQVAEICSFSRQTLARIERGDPSVSVGQVARCLDALGAPRIFAHTPPRVADTGKKRVRRTSLELSLAKTSTCADCALFDSVCGQETSTSKIS